MQAVGAHGRRRALALLRPAPTDTGSARWPGTRVPVALYCGRAGCLGGVGVRPPQAAVGVSPLTAHARAGVRAVRPRPRQLRLLAPRTGQRVASTASAPAPAGAEPEAGADAGAGERAWRQAQQLIQRQRLPQAWEHLTRAADCGHPEALARLGRWRLFGVLPPVCERDVAAAYASLLAAAKAGSGEAAFWLGRLHETGGREGDAGGAEEQQQAEGGAAASAPFDPYSGAAAEGDAAGDGERRRERARQVQAEIAALRRAARKAKVRRVKGLSAPTAPVSPYGAPPAVSCGGAARMAVDKAAAWEWYVLASSRDHVPAHVALGNMCVRAADEMEADGGAEAAGGGGGGGGSRAEGLLARAVEWYELAASAEPPHADALFNLGQLHWDGRVPGVPPQDARRAAVELFLRAADAGDASAAFFAAHVLHTGAAADAGVPPDGAKALTLLHRAADAGHGGAAHYLALAFRCGDAALGVEADSDAMWRWLRVAEEARHPETLFFLADAALHGREGVEVDEAAALRQFEAAGAVGHADALVSAAAMWYSGRGAPPGAGREERLRRAFDLYQQAAELHSLEAWASLAAMYAAGEGVARSVATAEHIRNTVLARRPAGE